MNDKSRTKEQLIAELTQLRTQNISLTNLVAESEARYRRLFETAGDGIVLLEKTERKQSENALEAVLKQSEEKFKKAYHSSPIITTITTMADVTELKRTEESLQESEEKYRSILKNMEESYFEVDIAGNFTFFNDSLCRLLGYPRDELMGMNNRQYTDKENAKILYQAFNEVFRTDKSARGFDWEVLRKDGTKRFIEASASLRKDISGQPIGFNGILHDITERKRAEEALRQSEVRYRSLFDSAHDAIILMDRNAIIDCNERAAELFRCPKEKIIGNTTTSFWPERQTDGRLTTEVSLEHIKKALRHERRSNEVRHRRADGTLVDTDVTLNIFKVNNKKYLQAIIRDITERKKTEENLLKTLKELQESKDMLVQSEKLAAIGRLSAGVAHEILNPVNIISMRLQLLEEMEGCSDMLEETIQVCQKQIDRIVKITKDISQFSRFSTKSLDLCDLNGIVEQTLYIANPRLKVENITTEVHVSPDLPHMMLDKYRIEQVMINLINNAIDAMADMDKKVLYVSTEKVVSDASSQWARITVTDTGEGISGDKLSKIFDPFFTTKGIGKGTGLGLFICFGIVQDHQGTITARSSEKGGASFIVDLPLSLPATIQ